MWRMMRVTIFIALLVRSGGCGLFGDVARDRSLALHQRQHNGDPSDAFTLDVSHLPADAVEQRTEDGRAGPVTRIELRAGYPVRVILVPATPP